MPWTAHVTCTTLSPGLLSAGFGSAINHSYSKGFGSMKLFGDTAMKVLADPGSFALAVARQFRANQGVLLAGAVAYYTLLSLIPLLILILMALSHVVPEDRLLVTLAEYLEFVAPGQSTALVEEVRK